MVICDYGQWKYRHFVYKEPLPSQKRYCFCPSWQRLFVYEMNKELQVEYGKYTRIVNKVLEELVKMPLLGAELAICLFIIRRTYGFHKTEDEISLTQFEEGVNRSRPTITKALTNLKLLNIIRLVKMGNSKNSSNLWTFNKYYETWQLVRGTELVKEKRSTSKIKPLQLVKGGLHTKEIQNITKERLIKKWDFRNY